MLKIRLLGGFRVEHNGKALTDWESFKTEALFAFLVLHPRETFRRPYLAGLLWPEKPERKAFTNLRHSLHKLRRVLPRHERYLHIDRVRAGFVPKAKYWLDVEEFLRLLQEAEPDPAPGSSSSPSSDTDVNLPKLVEAVGLYRGSFLEGHPAHEVDEWEWVARVREGLEARQVWALERLAEGYAKRAEHGEAAAYARKAVELQPYREELYRRLMRHLIAHGDFGEAARVYRECVRALEELGLTPGARTRELWEGIARREEPRPRSPKSKKIPPQVLTPLIGRERELDEALRLLRGSQEGGPGRLLTLVGPGGAGKSRLAREIAARTAGDYADGARFVPLEGVPDPSPVEEAIARALAVPTYGPGAEDARAALFRFLRGKELLLVLDGFEHLIVRADLTVELLREAPRLRLLVTSRERLHLPEERVLAVQGLALPRAAEDGTLEEAPAVRLFLHHARRMAPGLPLDDEDRQYVHKICAFLEGLPLGIELAAAWAHLLRPREIWEGLRRARGSLWTAPAGASEGILPRHRSLRAVLEHSWALLSPEERAVLPRLAVFRAGFDREAAEWIAQASPAVLAALIDKSLIHRGPRGRLRLHELVRAFVEEKLAESPEEAERTAERHAVYYLRFLRRREEALRGSGTIQALKEIEAEIENVRAAWAWAVRHKRADALNCALDGLYLYCFLRGRFREGGRLLRQARRRLRAGPDSLGDEDRLLLVRFLTREAVFLERRTRYRSARRRLERALDELCARLRPRSAEASPTARRIRREGALCLQRYGIVLHMMGEPRGGRRALEEAERWAQAAGDPWLWAHILRDRAISAQARGDFPQARDLATRSLRLFEEVGSDDGVATTSGTLSMISMSLGEYETARRWICQALRYLRRADQRWMLGLCYLNLGEIHRLKGRFPRAQRCAERGRAIFEEAGSAWGRVVSALGLGDIALSKGDWAGAVHSFREAERLAAEAGLIPERIRALYRLGRLALERDGGPDFAAARERLRQAVELLRTLKGDGPPNPLPAEVFVEVAFLWLCEGRTPEASQLLRAVLAGFPLYAQLRERAEALQARLPPPPRRTGEASARLPKQASRVEQLLQWVGARLSPDARAAEVAAGGRTG